MARRKRLRLEYRDAKDLADNPRNWRRHPARQTQSLEEMIKRVGWAGAALYNERTGRLIDGHLRKKIAGSKGKIPVLIGSWSEEEEALILSTFDPITALAQTDEKALKALLDSVDAEAEGRCSRIFFYPCESKPWSPTIPKKIRKDNQGSMDPVRSYARSEDMSSSADLKVGFCTHAAARYACKHWHYSGTLPMGRLVKFGIWEDGEFIGAIVYGDGVLGGKSPILGIRSKEQIAELVRVALTTHKTPVTRMIAITLKMLRKQSPDLQMVFSFADSGQGHLGTIYQAGNWIYTGLGGEAHTFRNRVTGKRCHSHNVTSTGVTTRMGGQSRCTKRADVVKIKLRPKFRYVMPLTDEARDLVEQFRKPYPKDVPEEGAGTARAGGSRQESSGVRVPPARSRKRRRAA